MHDFCTVKALVSPNGAYLILDTPEKGLLERALIHMIKWQGKM